MTPALAYVSAVLGLWLLSWCHAHEVTWEDWEDWDTYR